MIATLLLVSVLAAVVACVATAAGLRRLLLARDGRDARDALMRLHHELSDGPPPTIEELKAITAIPSRSRTRRAVTLLEHIGLLNQGEARIVADAEHLWVERRVHLTAAGARAAEILEACPSTSTFHPDSAVAPTFDTEVSRPRR